jgi:hypothetical protein
VDWGLQQSNFQLEKSFDELLLGTRHDGFLLADNSIIEEGVECKSVGSYEVGATCCPAYKVYLQLHYRSRLSSIGTMVRTSFEKAQKQDE